MKSFEQGIKTNILLTVLLVLLVVLNLVFGSVNIPVSRLLRILLGEDEQSSWAYIVWESRIPQILTAALCGASLATAGLLLQTTFRNPLAGPSILGITNGAGLGVGIVMLITGGIISIGGSMIAGFMSVITGALIGATAVIMLLLAFATVVRNNIMLLIVGIMISFLVSSMVMLLNFFATSDNIHSYVMWGMGSFSDVGMDAMPYFAATCAVGLILSLLLMKPLNAILLGDYYAANLGVDIKRTRLLLLTATGILTAASTAFCGPIAFVGLAVPHIARMLTNTSDHTILLPTTMLTGAVICMLCNLICVMPQNTVIPINAVTPVFGAPVIIYIMVKAGYSQK